MTDDPTFSSVGEENVRQHLRRRMEQHIQDGSIVGLRVPVLREVALFGRREEE